MGRRRDEEDDYDVEAFLKRLGKHLGKVRASRGYSQDLLGDECGLARGTISKIESAKSSPKAVTLARIAKVLGIPLSKLMDVDV